MKSTTHFYTALFLILICFLACEPKKASPILGLHLDAYSASDDCRVENPAKPGEYLPFQITSDCAEGFMDDYETYTEGVLDTLIRAGADSVYNTEKLVRGAMVHLQELRGVLVNTTSHANDSLYVMMGIMQNDSTELIFALKSATSGDWTYFDFTRPCPTACPN